MAFQGSWAWHGKTSLEPDTESSFLTWMTQAGFRKGLKVYARDGMMLLDGQRAQVVAIPKTNLLKKGLRSRD